MTEKNSFRKTALMSLFCLFAILACVDCTYGAERGKPAVIYDKKTDRISVEAADVSLQTLLEEIANKSDVKIQLDSLVEKKVSVRIKDHPIEKVLKKITKGMNCAMIFGVGKDEKTVLKSARIFPIKSGNSKKVQYSDHKQSSRLGSEEVHSLRKELDEEKLNKMPEDVRARIVKRLEMRRELIEVKRKKIERIKREKEMENETLQ